MDGPHHTVHHHLHKGPIYSAVVLPALHNFKYGAEALGLPPPCARITSRTGDTGTNHPRSHTPYSVWFYATTATFTSLGALRFISNQHINARWVRPSFDSATLLGAGGNMDEICTCFTRREKDAHACPTDSLQRLVECLVPCLLEGPCVPPGSRCSIVLCVWLSRRVRAPFVFPFFFSVEDLG